MWSLAHGSSVGISEQTGPTQSFLQHGFNTVNEDCSLSIESILTFLKFVSLHIDTNIIIMANILFRIVSLTIDTFHL